MVEAALLAMIKEGIDIQNFEDPKVECIFVYVLSGLVLEEDENDIPPILRWLMLTE
jgi:catabolite regulation protein CreA